MSSVSVDKCFCSIVNNTWTSHITANRITITFVNIFRKDLEITKRKAENVASKSPEDLKEPFHTKVCLILNLTYGKDMLKLVMKLE